MQDERTHLDWLEGMNIHRGDAQPQAKSLAFEQCYSRAVLKAHES